MAQDEGRSEAANQKARELPGTLGCIAGFALLAVLLMWSAFPAPYGLVTAVCFTLIYVGLIALFGQGSIIEMGLATGILLLLTYFLVSPRFHEKQQDDERSAQTTDVKT